MVDNVMLEEPRKIEEAFLNHYINLLGTDARTQSMDLGSLYSQYDNLLDLDMDFTHEEIEVAIKGLANNKASDPDGVPNEFPKKNWHIIKDEI
jgi:hypothetical protein